MQSNSYLKTGEEQEAETTAREVEGVEDDDRQELGKEDASLCGTAGARSRKDSSAS